MSESKNIKQTAFRIPDSILKRAKAEAKRYNKSLNSLVVTILDSNIPKEK